MESLEGNISRLRQGSQEERCAAAARLARAATSRRRWGGGPIAVSWKGNGWRLQWSSGRHRGSWPIVVGALLEQLVDPDPVVRSACEGALYQMQAGELATSFRSFLSGEWPEVEALIRYRRARHREALRKACRPLAMGAGSLQMRRQALRFLAWIRDGDSLWPLLRSLFAPAEEFPYKVEAMQSLARYPALLRALGLAPLSTLLAQGDWPPHWEVERLTWLLEECGRSLNLRGASSALAAPEIVRHYINFTYRQRRQQRHWGFGAGEPAWYRPRPTWWEWLQLPLLHLLTILPNDKEPVPPEAGPTLRRLAEWWDQVVVRLGRFPAEWRQFFHWSPGSSQWKRDNQPEVRAAALAVFQFAGQSIGETALFAALSDPDEQVRELARMGLRQRGLEELERAVSGGLGRDPAAIPLLRELSDERVKWALLFALLQGDQQFHAPAAWALGEWGDASAIPTLRWISRPWRSVARETKQAAVEAIAQIERLNLERAIVLVDRPADVLGSPERSLTLAEGEGAAREQRALTPAEEPEKERLIEGVEAEGQARSVTARRGEPSVKEGPANDDA